MLADLSTDERRIIEWLLPSDKPFYSSVRASLELLPTVHTDDGALNFGNYDDSYAETVAIGAVRSADATTTVALRMNEDSSGGQLQLSGHADLRLLWTLSDWTPGDRSPEGGAVREIRFWDTARSPRYTLALSPAERVLWLHHVTSGYNQLLPVTGILVELARMMKPVASERLTSEQFFSLAERATDAQLIQAVLEYNKRAKKFDASRIISEAEKPRRGLFDFIRNRR